MTTVDTARDPASLTSPFVGLTSYAQENAPFFFGRDAEQRVLISNLRASRLTLLYAQSGAGKSSVLRAGAAAKLAELARRSIEQRGSARHIPVVFSSWRDEPTGELIAEIEKAITPFLPEPSPPGRTLERLDEVIEAASNAAGATLLVMLDQFEEYFLYRPREAHDDRFADELAACINRAGLHANFLISIREDAYSGLGDLFQGRIRNVYSNYLHLEHLTRESAREAIEKPITSFNELHPTEVPVEIESGLVDVILGQLGPDQFAPDQRGIGRLTGGNGSDLRGGEIAASYLQLVMKRLWETEVTRGSRTLHRATLEKLGGAQTIVRTHVDRALDDLPEEAREAAVDIFHHLITPSGTKIALTASDLAEYTGRPAAEATTLLERLASSDTRILRPVPPPPGQEGRTRYEISHDLLAPAILDWGRRQRAVRLEREKESAERLARVEKRRARMFRTLALGSAALLIIAIVALIAAVHNAANTARQHAIGLSRQLAAESLSVDPTDPVTARRLAVAAWRIFPTGQAGSAMTTLLGEQQQNGILLADPVDLSQGGVNGVAFSPDGRLLVGAEGAGSVRLWNPATGRLVRVLHVTTGSYRGVNAVAVSPDGRLLASADADGTVRLLDLVTGHPVRRLRGNSRGYYNGVSAVAFSPDGRLLASADADLTVRLWNPATGQMIRVLRIRPTGFSPSVNAVAFSPDGRLLATADGDGTVRLWDPATGQPIRALHAGGSTIGVLGVAFSPDGRLLAAADGDGTVRLWDPATGQRVHVLHATSGGNGVTGVAFSPDGRLLASAGGDGTLRLWDPATGEALGVPLRLPASALAVRGGLAGVAFSPDGSLLAAADRDGTVRLVDLATGRPVGASLSFATVGQSSGVDGVAYSHDGKLLATAGQDGTVGLWDLATDRPVHLLQVPPRGPDNAVEAVAFSPDGRLLASADGNGTVQVWDPVTGRLAHLLHISGVGYNVWGVVFSPDGKLLASAGATVRLWDPATGQPIRILHASSGNPYWLSVAFSPDSRLLAAAGSDGIVRLWNLATGQQVRALHAPKQPNGVNDVAFSPDNKLLAAAGSDGIVRLWNLATGQQVRALHAASRPNGVGQAPFSPNGKLLASTAGPGIVQLWNPATGHALGVPFGLVNAASGVNAVAFNPDGKLLASADTAGTVRFWNVPAFVNPYATLCAAVGGPTQQEWKQYAPGEPQSRVCS